MREMDITPRRLGFDIRIGSHAISGGTTSFVLEPDVDKVTYLRRNNEEATVTGTSEHIRVTLATNGYSVIFKRHALNDN